MNELSHKLWITERRIRGTLKERKGKGFIYKRGRKWLMPNFLLKNLRERKKERDKYICFDLRAHLTFKSITITSILIIHILSDFISSKLVKYDVRFEVFTAVTMKNGVFWVVTPCGLQEPHGVTTQKTPFFCKIRFVKILCFMVRDKYDKRYI
jgi:hypothetical protein